MNAQSYSRNILALTDVQLEQFVREWVEHKTPKYYEIKQFTGPGDRGRDVVGFLSPKRHEGDWHNYQCKQYATNISTGTAIHELGKILYYAFLGEFTAPAKYYFVAPRGVNRNLEALIYNPTQFQKRIIDDWEKYCAHTIIDGTHIPLTDELRNFLSAYSYENIDRLKLDDFIKDPAITPVLYNWFGADPGPAPKGSVPGEVQAEELKYISQLLGAYGQREGLKFKGHHELAGHPSHLNHLGRQRERFYDADAFKRFYRDNTNTQIIKTFEDEVLHGVIDICDASHKDSLEKINAVMAQAASVQPSGLLANHAGIPVKQGICHHFVNEDQLSW